MNSTPYKELMGISDILVWSLSNSLCPWTTGPPYRTCSMSFIT